ncbi:LEM-3-like GIY-YIG domain-containing protein [Halopseudomonas yangmingensis]|uniref:GIY-YIG domain-containing protein n=1 Tax=Halopseudomonas yangmingensis TaxID=1720063 RepID=A0A1I4N8H0_9GAMM|nr:hypothetical protein [Halopseudomonas yangmingensis]SFM11570.1 hypothetical protein SAMN05216217_101113 [Halopseudomonas yangmingensis]
MKFSQQTRLHLRFYVYGLVDPRDQKIFYIGKASANNRAFDHLKAAATESRKSQRISEIRAAGCEPSVEVLRYGLETESAAFDVEAALIDAFGLENLTNSVRGHGVDRGRMPAEVVERLHGAKPVVVTEIDEPCMVFFIKNTYTPTQSEQEIYDSVRQFWYQVSESNRENLSYRIALGVVDGVVIRAYSIAGWFPAGSTFSTRKYESERRDKWEFVGQKIDGHALVGRLLVGGDGLPIPAVQNGYTYLQGA